MYIGTKTRMRKTKKMLKVRKYGKILDKVGRYMLYVNKHTYNRIDQKPRRDE
jgi:hypothetical protein